jgi:DNA invertase Pin-like site-specific DNA recombinase
MTAALKCALVIAYSYVRFSTPEQARGDSYRRQTEKALAYCKRRGWTLDDSLKADRGVSAWRGKNALLGNLKVFLDRIASGAVKPGSVLIVECIDRISRQGIDEGGDLIKKILKAGILIVTLSPEREFDVTATKSLARGWIEILLILERAAEESERKSERVGEAWREKQRRVLAGEFQKATEAMGTHCCFLTKRLPGWVEAHNGTLRLIEHRAEAVRLIFRLAAAGYGQQKIVRKLIKDGVPSFLGKGWNRTYIKTLLADKRTIGEFQLRNTDGSKRGKPVKDYFPSCLDAKTFYEARAAVEARDRRGPRVGKYLDLFPGLLRDSRDGGNMMVTTRTEQVAGGARRSRLIVPARAWEDGTTCVSFPMPTFERALLSCLREVSPEEVNGHEKEPDRTAALEGEQADLEAQEETLRQALRGRVVDVVIDELEKIQGRVREIEAELERERARLEVSTPAESWKDAHGLIDLLDGAEREEQKLRALGKAGGGLDPDDPGPAQDVRLRLRAALARAIDSVWLTIVARGRDRLAAVQVWFAGGKRQRIYLVMHRPPKSNGKARVEGGARAAALASVVEAGDFDLRDRGDADLLRAQLERIDTGKLWDALAD